MRAGFDWRRFGRDVRKGIAGRALRPLAEEVGVTSTDLSRASSGTNVSIEKVLAMCDAFGLSARRYYQKPSPEKSARCTSAHVKQEARA